MLIKHYYVLYEIRLIFMRNSFEVVRIIFRLTKNSTFGVKTTE